MRCSISVSPAVQLGSKTSLISTIWDLKKWTWPSQASPSSTAWWPWRRCGWSACGVRTSASWPRSSSAIRRSGGSSQKSCRTPKKVISDWSQRNKVLPWHCGSDGWAAAKVGYSSGAWGSNLGPDVSPMDKWWPANHLLKKWRGDISYHIPVS